MRAGDVKGGSDKPGRYSKYTLEPVVSSMVWYGPSSIEYTRVFEYGRVC
jgi:hypothetical protein